MDDDQRESTEEDEDDVTERGLEDSQLKRLDEVDRAKQKSDFKNNVKYIKRNDELFM